MAYIVRKNDYELPTILKNGTSAGVLINDYKRFGALSNGQFVFISRAGLTPVIAKVVNANQPDLSIGIEIPKEEEISSAGFTIDGEYNVDSIINYLKTREPPLLLGEKGNLSVLNTNVYRPPQLEGGRRRVKRKGKSRKAVKRRRLTKRRR